MKQKAFSPNYSGYSFDVTGFRKKLEREMSFRISFHVGWNILKVGKFNGE